MTTKFNKIEIQVKPFIGIMAVDPAQAGRISTAPPSILGGNMDNKELVEGTTLYLPVFVKGGLFAIGDAHAGQGDGEVNITAMETALDKSVMKITVRKDLKLTKPFAETPTHYVAMGLSYILVSDTVISGHLLASIAGHNGLVGKTIMLMMPLIRQLRFSIIE